MCPGMGCVSWDWDTCPEMGYVSWDWDVGPGIGTCVPGWNVCPEIWTHVPGWDVYPEMGCVSWDRTTCPGMGPRVLGWPVSQDDLCPRMGHVCWDVTCVPEQALLCRLGQSQYLGRRPHRSRQPSPPAMCQQRRQPQLCLPPGGPGAAVGLCPHHGAETGPWTGHGQGSCLHPSCRVPGASPPGTAVLGPLRHYQP